MQRLRYFFRYILAVKTYNSPLSSRNSPHGFLRQRMLQCLTQLRDPLVW
jgi:hypothetical protein